MQIGIRLHDVNAALSAEKQTLEARVATAREEGFTCVHLAFSKVIRGVTFDAAALTEGLGVYAKNVFARAGLDVAVLGCYLNLAHPDPEKRKEIQSRYYGNIRLASIMGASVVGTETGAPNEQYKLDDRTHTQEALDSFIRALAPVVECAENYGVSLAIEPVWNHIVYNADQAVQVLKTIRSRNLRIILDPVNLLYAGNVEERDSIFADAIDKLGEQVAVVHLKDFVREGDTLHSVAAGTGGMDYSRILRFIKERKPFIQATLENTSNDNAVAAKTFLEEVYQAV